ncbi:hypothetical protein CVO_09385 [Sulfurimonas sp. CVO]|uniref:hypothetical protein n=1 Tax=Sulfurimonas sp. CVO TaxID=2283483 RepID=UPI00132EFBE8|nr:hypothetical protein [Sulfurimonas sp. CVO]QHG92019.1 hypothetical protein CVO_09385 [Sulfurimonas sp. CVO]
MLCEREISKDLLKRLDSFGRKYTYSPANPLNYNLNVTKGAVDSSSSVDEIVKNNEIILYMI